MYQVLGLRPVKNSRKPVEVFFEKGWRFDSHFDMFNEDKLNAMLASIPIDEHWNLYYTVADCYEESGRKLKEQWMIPFDIDNLAVRTSDGNLVTETARRELAISACHVASQVLGVNFEDLSIVFSGNGVQFFIMLDSPITSVDYIKNTREHYKELCASIQAALKKNNISGDVDTSVWSGGRIMRLANTTNKKPNRSDSRAFLIQTGRTISFKLDDTGIILTNNEEYVRTYPKPDTLAVCDGCSFLKFCKEKQAEVKEPAWFAMTTILVRLEDGAKLVHEYSSQHPSYSVYETEVKIEHALESTKPRTCKDISTRWDGCATCDNYGKVTSPIMIKGADYIATEETGYREYKSVQQPDGTTKSVIGKVAYDDVVKAFGKLHPFFSCDDILYVYTGKNWEVKKKNKVSEWVYRVIKPAPNSKDWEEVYKRLLIQRVSSRQEMLRSTQGLMNFNNCVVNFMTGETFPHSEEYGFTSVCPFDYDPYATCPTWNKFMDDITDGDKVKRQILEEFAGYALSDDVYWSHKALFLVGDGANGKSKFAETLIYLAGDTEFTPEDNKRTAAASLKELESAEVRGTLMHKLFNYSDETSKLTDTDTFKKLSSGMPMSYRIMYVGTGFFNNKAKFISSSNQMPDIKDTTGGMERRLCIIKFTRKFNSKDPNTDKYIGEKLKKEASGIYNVLMKAYKDLKLRGDLVEHEETQDNLKEYMLDNDSVAQFFNDAVTITHDDKDCIKVMEVFQDYVTYCQMAGEKHPCTKNLFGKRFSKISKVESKVKHINSIASRCYTGIKIKKDY